MDAINLCEELISTYEEYVDLFDKELNSIIGLAVAHRYYGEESSYQNGIRIRERIKEIVHCL